MAGKLLRVVISNSIFQIPASINEYSIQNLDNFVDKISRILDFSSTDLAVLSENKIKYFLCRDEAEIKNLTGFNTMGMYYLPYDYLITTYNSAITMNSFICL